MVHAGLAVCLAGYGTEVQQALRHMTATTAASNWTQDGRQKTDSKQALPSQTDS